LPVPLYILSLRLSPESRYVISHKRLPPDAADSPQEMPEDAVKATSDVSHITRSARLLRFPVPWHIVQRRRLSALDRIN